MKKWFFQFKLKIFTCLCFWVIIPSAVLSAQDSGDDFGIWTYIQANHSFTKKLSISVKGELRTQNDTKSFKEWKINPNIAYKFCPYFSLGAGYLFSYNYNSAGEPIGPAHRWHIEVTGSVSAGIVQFSLRARFQEIFLTTRPVGSDGNPTNMFRPRLMVKFAPKSGPFTPYINGEYFLYLWDYKGRPMKEARFSVGTDIRLSSQDKLDIWYKYIFPASGSTRNLHELGVGYAHTF